jgi:hypothetical protein
MMGLGRTWRTVILGAALVGFSAVSNAEDRQSDRYVDEQAYQRELNNAEDPANSQNPNYPEPEQQNPQQYYQDYPNVPPGGDSDEGC